MKLTRNCEWKCLVVYSLCYWEAAFQPWKMNVDDDDDDDDDDDLFLYVIFGPIHFFGNFNVYM